MKIKERTIKDLNVLEPSQIMAVYDLIQNLKEKLKKNIGYKSVKAYLQVQDALKTCKGNISDDIIYEREDRI